MQRLEIIARSGRITLLALAINLVLASAAFGAEGYGNTTAQEYGDPVYRVLVWSEWGITRNYNHAGMFAGINSSDSKRVLHASGYSDTVKDVSFASAFTNYGSDYYGAYTHKTFTLDFADRKAIVKHARDIDAEGVYYTAVNALDPITSSRPVAISNINNIRCDGLVEYCYDREGCWSWWPTDDPGKYSIYYNPESHNNMPGLTVNPDYELSPWAQRGAPQNTGPSFSGTNPNNAYLNRSAVIDLPTYEVSTWQDGTHAVVRIKATDDKSGIHMIGYMRPGESSWSYSRNVQHPTSDSYTKEYNVYSSGWFYYFAQDNGGNYPDYAEGIWVEIVEPPSKATNPSPSNGATGRSINTNISWSNGGGATSYDVYFGTDSSPDSGEYKGNQTGTSYDPGTLNYNTTYYWRIDAKNSDGTTTGDVWHFTTESPPVNPPSKATNPSPSNGATGRSINTNISWSNGGGATSYDVYFGTDSSPDSGEYKGNQTGTSYDPGTLNYNTTYYWRIDAKNSDGTTTGDVWHFTTESPPVNPPSKATNPSPSNGATGRSINTNISWSNGGGATSYDVYFGTDSSPDSGEYKGNQTGTSYDPGTLNYNTTYYWRIDAKNSDGTTTGDVWYFSTLHQNNAPELSSGNVNPSSGYTSTPFTYAVNYYDQDGDSPSTKYVYIDGSPYTMSLSSGSAPNGMYEYQTTLPVGDHNYYFYFADGNGGADRLPNSGVFLGPAVSGSGNIQKIQQVAAGTWHTVGLELDGTVVAVGRNDDGRCNVGSWTDIQQVAAGSGHTVGLKSDGTVVAVGYNDYGGCNVGSWTDIQQVDAGGYHTVGLKSDGTVVAVGRNDDGQCNVGSWTNIQQVDAGYYHTIGLQSDGTVVAVGRNDEGQCNVGSWTDIQQVDAGGYHTVGLESDGTVVAVGLNHIGQCNLGSWTDIQQVAAGCYHTVGLESDGTVVAVGYNNYGQCNLGSWTDIQQVAAAIYNTVGLESDGTVVAVGRNDYGQCDVDNWGLGVTKAMPWINLLLLGD